MNRVLGLGALVLIAVMLFNVAIVYALLERHQLVLNRIDTIDSMRIASQKLAVRAMRLADGAVLQTSRIAPEIETMERMIAAIDQGGVVGAQQIAPLQDPELRAYIARIRQAWSGFRARLQSVILSSYTRDTESLATQESSAQIIRQWLADDSAALLGVLDDLIFKQYDILRTEKNSRLWISLGLVVLDVLVVLALLFLALHHLARPLRLLGKASESLARGFYDAQVNYRSNFELNDVIRNFNSGVRKLQEQMRRTEHDKQRLERADTIFRGLVSNSIVGIFLLENDRFSFVSQKMADIFGYEPDEMIGSMGLLGLIVPRERYLMAEAIKSSQSRRDGTLRLERRGRCKSGKIIDIEIFSTTIKVGEQVNIIGIVQDITESKHAESSAQLAAIAYENSSEAIVITDAAGVVIDVNPSYSRMTGFWPDEIAGEQLPLLRPGRHNHDFYDDMWHSINTKGRWEGEYWAQRKSGEQYAERVILDTAWNHDGSVNCRVAMLSDITQKKQIESQIWHQAHHDPLTALPNRQYFNERLQQAVDSANRAQHTLALLFLDLDLFKEVNDTLGHATGDGLLVKVAKRLQEKAEVVRAFCDCAKSSQTCNFVARLGGDEFVILIDRVQAGTALDEYCEDLLAKITEPYHIGPHEIRISASLGVAIYPHDGDSAETLMQHVDMAMYQAKELGRNQYSRFDDEMRNRATMQHDLQHNLAEAIANKQFYLLYQPIYELESGRVVGAEVLLRWNHPRLGVIAPLEFIPFIEARQLMKPLELWVFEQALAQLQQWRASAHPQFQLALNTSVSMFGADDHDLPQVLELLAGLGLPASAISLEFGDEALGTAGPRLMKKLRALRKEGVNFSLGTTAMGLPALLATEDSLFATLRIKQEISAQLQHGTRTAMVLKATIELAHALGVQVVAEGVSSSELHQGLRALGCDYGQGYWLAEPLEAGAMGRLLAQ